MLTNAMQPMQRPKVKRGLLDLNERFGARLTLRVSLDHYTQALHEAERGARTWARTIAGLDWLAAERLAGSRSPGAPAGTRARRTARAGYARLIAEHGWPVDAADPAELVLLPEMDGKHDVPEITTRCWAILKKSPGDMMCASSRMVIKRQGRRAADRAALHADRLRSGLRDGATLAEAGRGRWRHVRRRRRQALPPALLEVLRAGRRQLLGALTDAEAIPVKAAERFIVSRETILRRRRGAGRGRHPGAISSPARRGSP